MSDEKIAYFTMKLDLFTSAQAAALLFIGQMIQYVGSLDQQYNYYNNHADPPPSNQYDYREEPAPPPPQDYTYDLPQTIACFACTLVIRDGYEQGLANCNDPFVRLDVPSVDCKGPCGKLYHQHGERDFVVTRGCLPNCKEHRDDKSYTQCCTKAYCNTSRSNHRPGYALAILLASILTLLFASR